MYYQEEVEKKERRKVIILATIVVLVILMLLVAIIVVATKKSSRPSLTAAENSAVEINAEQNQATESETGATASEAENASETEATIVGGFSTETTATTTDSGAAAGPVQRDEVSGDISVMPATGPEDILPIALIVGALIAYLGSAKLARRERRI